MPYIIASSCLLSRFPIYLRIIFSPDDFTSLIEAIPNGNGKLKFFGERLFSPAPLLFLASFAFVTTEKTPKQGWILTK